MGSPSWGHVSRRCAVCGSVGPRTWSLEHRGHVHKRCLDAEKRDARDAALARAARDAADRRAEGDAHSEAVIARVRGLGYSNVAALAVAAVSPPPKAGT